MSDILTSLTALVPGLDVVEHNARRFYIRIPRERLTDAAKHLHRQCGLRLAICTGIDTREGFEVLYHFCDDRAGIFYTLKVIAPKDDARIDSLGSWLPAAAWIEREMHELLGIDFPGHPALDPLLTSDTDWESGRYPLRRDYERRGEAHEQ